MPLWTTYLAFLSRNKEDILKRLKCFSTKHGAIIHYVMRKRGNDEVAPSETLLLLGKKGLISWEEYAQNYLMDIRDDSDAYNFMFNVAEDSKNLEVILVCFEKDANHCHRTLLANEIVRTFKDVEYKGELSSLFERER